MTTIDCLGKSYEVHPAAELFPMIAGEELQKLADDISTHGLLVPIIRYDGKILDGRNRLRACNMASFEPQFEEWDEEGGDPIAFVVSLNRRRRHMTESQLAAFAVRLAKVYDQVKEERKLANLRNQKPESSMSPTGDIEKGRSSELAAKAVGVGARNVQRAQRVENVDPVLFEKIETGEVTVRQAETTIARREQRQQIREHRPANGVFTVIVADPPWMYDVRADDETHRGRIPYPPMTLDAIGAYLKPERVDANAILFLWVTNAHLVDGSAAKVLEAWGFEGKTLYTWVKVDAEGKPRMGGGNWGRNCTEHVILAVKGQPKIDFDAAARIPTVFFALRGEHSEKPDTFFVDVAEPMCPHPARLELFARKLRAGWVCDGVEIEVAHDVGFTAGADPVPVEVDAPAPISDDEPTPSALSAPAPAVEDIGIIAIRSVGAGFDGLVESLAKGDIVEVKSKGAKAGVRALVVGWTNDHKLQVKLERLDRKNQPTGYEDTPWTMAASQVLAIVAVTERHIDPLSKSYAEQIRQWARDELDPAKPVTWRDVNDCWVALLTQAGTLRANQRPMVGVVLRDAHEKLSDPATATGGIKPQPPARPRATPKRGPMVDHGEI